MQEPYFMNNQKISARQVKRTLTLELLGISTLLLPSLVATDSGVDGFFALTAGGGGAWLLLKFWQKHFRQQDFSQRLEQMSGCVRVCIQVIYGMGFLGLAGFVFYVMAALMEQQLLGNGWEPMILLTLAAAAFFGLVRGLESRVRVYEVLYWFLLIPLLVILVIAWCRHRTKCMDTGGSIDTSEFHKKQLCELFVFLRSILICAVSEKLSEKRTGICRHTTCSACGTGAESGNLSHSARRIPHRTAGAPQMAGH